MRSRHPTRDRPGADDRTPRHRTTNRSGPTGRPTIARRSVASPGRCSRAGCASSPRPDWPPARPWRSGSATAPRRSPCSRSGWRVLAIDPTPAAAEVLRPRVPPSAASRLEIVTARVDAVELPPYDLLYAGYALPFIRPEAFPRVWADVGRPGPARRVPGRQPVRGSRHLGRGSGHDVRRRRARAGAARRPRPAGCPRARERRRLVRRAEALARVRHRRPPATWTASR